MPPAQLRGAGVPVYFYKPPDMLPTSLSQRHITFPNPTGLPAASSIPQSPVTQCHPVLPLFPGGLVGHPQIMGTLLRPVNHTVDPTLCTGSL